MNKHLITDQYKQAIIDASLTRACMKRRPRGIFTYTGNRYDDGRRDLKLSLKEHFVEAVNEFNNSVFDNQRDNIAFNQDAMSLKCEADLVYLDPPYYSVASDNEYVRRYHFVEGLAKDWKGLKIQNNTKTKKFKNYPTPFSTKKGTYDAFQKLFRHYSNNQVLVSYSSNSLPTKEEMLTMMNQNFTTVKVYEVDYKYSFGTQSNKVNNNRNSVKEYLFLGY